MAEVTLTPQQSSVAGITPSYTGSLATTNTYNVKNPGNVLINWKKSAAVNCTVTIVTPGTVGGNAIADLTIVVAATTGNIIAGPFPPSIYNNGLGNLQFTCSDVDGLTVAVVQM